jgi:hypothetical protein
MSCKMRRALQKVMVMFKSEIVLSPNFTNFPKYHAYSSLDNLVDLGSTMKEV